MKHQDSIEDFPAALIDSLEDASSLLLELESLMLMLASEAQSIPAFISTSDEDAIH